MVKGECWVCEIKNAKITVIFVDSSHALNNPNLLDLRGRNKKI